MRRNDVASGVVSEDHILLLLADVSNMLLVADIIGDLLTSSTTYLLTSAIVSSLVDARLPIPTDLLFFNNIAPSSYNSIDHATHSSNDIELEP